MLKALEFYLGGVALSWAAFAAMLYPDAGWAKVSLLMGIVWPVAWFDLFMTIVGAN